MRIEVKRLGLAAYIKMNGGVLVGRSNGAFVIETERTEEDWEVEYLNSCCYHHDTEVMNLRKLMK